MIPYLTTNRCLRSGQDETNQPFQMLETELVVAPPWSNRHVDWSLNPVTKLLSKNASEDLERLKPPRLWVALKILEDTLIEPKVEQP